MALLENGLLKGSASMALWGLGIYVGLCVAAPLLGGVAKPLVKEANRGYQSLRSRLKRAAGAEAGEDQPEAEIEIAGQAVTGSTPAEAGVAAMALTAETPAVAGDAIMEAAAPAPSRPAPKATKRQRKPVARGAKPSAGWSTKAALYERAKELKIAGRSAMSKEQLVAAVQTAIAAPETA